MAYVDVSSAWNLPRRFDRIRVALGGMAVETLIAFMLVIAWGFQRSPVAADWLFRAALLAGVNTLLFNINPLGALDGYHALSDWWSQPNLGERARVAAGRTATAWLFGSRKDGLHAGESAWIALFGLASWMWSIGMAPWRLLAITVWWQGWGLLLAGGGRDCFRPRSLRTAGLFLKEACARPWAAVRATVLMCAVTAALVATASVVPSPWTTRAPVHVAFRDEVVVRAPVEAFVDDVFVRTGDIVEPGRLLVRLRTTNSAHAFASWKPDWGNWTSLSDRHLERQDTRHSRSSPNSCVPRAWNSTNAAPSRTHWMSAHPCAGRVVAAAIDQRIGAWVESGAELVNLGDGDRLELVAYVAEGDLADPQGVEANGAEWTFRLRSGRHGATFPERVLPRSRDTLDHPALGTPLGGPLAWNSARELVRDRS